MNIENPVLKKATNVSFSFYTSDEIRNLSVKQITNPVALDNLGHPTTGGLYDLVLGPYEREDSCRTCGLGYFEYSGHFGHIELPVPLYNTIVSGLYINLCSHYVFAVIILELEELR
ncbi:beta and beta-prime subunits of DNA dependent RNA-polymerase [Neocallimastix californiae]|uniref:DNA-directed RNA polymerase n=1 Tax=Neocallimastix californiae TaxID=1754190 RepID=A0A1Y2ARS4_9FUNG|nr:beta and beta-prime subunits of DNA dependent RNA-polymerase [Neocallimastix californiae]|eukprot:ORY25000.1 beta and beta-prime subunits of DNA dependent RNA-polymerase [Neocallimastix californiae]